jgi:putative membrane protein
MLSSDGKSTEDRLGILNGVEFDRAYVNGEVSFHQSVLDTIDEKLLPNAKNADLQAMLKKTKPEVQAHLEHARKVQSKLSQ